MIFRRTLLVLLAAVIGGAASAGPVRRGEPVRAVLELFTSQSCSACPPADRLFQSLAREADVLALTLPVTIWDHLGWKDTLAKTVFSERQKDYCRSRGDRNVYTPQAVVNGIAHVRGSDLAAIETARKDTGVQDGVLSLSLGLEQQAGRWRLAIPAASVKGRIVLVTFDRSHTVSIARGENSGREIQYAIVVTAMRELGAYEGAALSLDLPGEVEADPVRGFAVIVQDGDGRRPGAVLGAVEAPRR